MSKTTDTVGRPRSPDVPAPIDCGVVAPEALSPGAMRLPDTPRLIAFLVAGAFFMEFLDGTVIATAIPQMAVSFGVRPADLGIGMSAYLLTLAVLLPLSGWVADRYGPRLVFGGALAVFTLASLLCAASTGLAFFVAARIVQGAGGAMMVPVGRLVVLRTTAKPDLLRAIATLTWPALVAPILAPPLGGFLTAYASWRWIFLINLPIGLFGVALAVKLMPTRSDVPARRLDWIGFGLTALACLAIMSGLEAVGAAEVDWTRVTLLLGIGLVAGISAVWAARRHPSPLLDLEPLRIPSFAVSVFGGSLFRIAVSVVPFLLPLMFQIGFGLDAFHSGLLVVAVFVGNLGIKPATSGILRRFGFRTVLIGNGALTALAIAACALIGPSTPLPATLAVLLVGGAARSMQLTAINSIAFSDVPPERMGAANTLFAMTQQISLGLGIAIGVVALRVARMLVGATGPTTVAEFHLAMLLTAAVAAASILDAVPLARDTAIHVSRR